MSISQSGGQNVKTIRCVLPSTGDFDGNLRISLSTSYIQVVVRAGVIKLLSITQTDRGNSPEIVTEKLENVVNCSCGLC